MGSQNTLAIQQAATGAHQQLSIGKTMEVTKSKATCSPFPQKAWSYGCPYNLDSWGNPKVRRNREIHNPSVALSPGHQVFYW